MNIVNWLYSVGVLRIDVEGKTGDGNDDIYLPNRRVIIETKQKGYAQPHNTTHGSRPGETPLEQCSRYVYAEKNNEVRGLDADIDNVDLPWLGIVTDSQIWHIFQLTDIGFKPLTEWNGRRLDSTNISSLKKLLIDRKVGKEWVPDDPTDILKEPLDILKDTYEKNKDKRDVMTQRELWHRQLTISGNQPDENHKDKLFVLHTLLIVISIKISEMYGNEKDTQYGFTSWVKNTDWLPYIDKIIKKYNWKQTTADTLRAVYMGLVDKKDRHIYGEYYTPDWLAEKLCEDVIDDEYIESWVRQSEYNIKKIGGIMDPTCGSGTFLYHAVRRILHSKPVMDATMTDRDLTDMIIQMIYGIDIHPVAVAMAKANILRALPEKPSAPLHIYQGDSLQITRNVDDDDHQQKIDELESQIFKITSREGTEIRLPLEFIQSKNFDTKMHRFVKAAVQGKIFPARVDDDIKSESRRAILHKAFDILTKVCKKEGNDIWAWYVINYAGVYLLKQRISRIVANPPWVVLSSIQDETRKNEIIELAKDLDLWVGGKNAGNFNIASLFVIQCASLYGLNKNNIMKSGWVLPAAAMKGGNWVKYTSQTNAPVLYDLGNLAFPTHSESCVNLFGVQKQKPLKLVLKSGEEIPTQSESWNTIMMEKTKFIQITQQKIKKSEWFEGRRSIARSGARMAPACLVVLDSKKEIIHTNNRTHGITETSRQGVWRGKSFPVDVPTSWLKPVIFNNGGLLPYVIGNPRQCILPINEKGEFLHDRDSEKWWRDATDKYVANAGKGASTPKTLEKRLNYNNMLICQFPLVKNHIIYNKAGSNIMAARLPSKMIIADTVFKVQCVSENEALFLTSIINTDCLHDAFKNTQKSDRDFQTYFWYEIPIPRFNEKNPNHAKLVNFAKHAEQVANGIHNPTYDKIKQTLRDDGISHDIDKIVSQIVK